MNFDRKIEQQNLDYIICYQYCWIRIEKSLSSDANFIPTIFIYLEQSRLKKKHGKQKHLIH
jgi:hypothetical protein